MGAALSLVFAGGCQQEAAATSEFALGGTVIDERSRAGIGAAQVTFTSDTLDETQATTDGEGRFSMVVSVSQNVRFGTLRVEREGYLNLSETTVYFDGTERTVELVLRPQD